MAEGEEVSVQELMEACKAAQDQEGYPFIVTYFRPTDCGATSLDPRDSESQGLEELDVAELNGTQPQSDHGCPQAESPPNNDVQPLMGSTQINGSLNDEGGNSQISGNLDVDPEANGLAPSKRKRRISGKINWTSELHRRKRMKGEEYLGYERVGGEADKRARTKAKDARKLGPTCSSVSCAKIKSMSCNQFPESTRQKMFTDFWENMDWSQKQASVRNLVDQTETKNPGKGKDSRRSNTFVYYLKLNGLKKRVCRSMFMSTLGLHPKELRNWLINQEKTTEQRSLRGKYKVDEREVEAETFLNQLPKMPSHYCRASTDKMYLEPDIQNFTQLYDIYKKDCQANKKAFYGQTQFIKIVNEMRLDVYRLKKDACDICIGHKKGSVPDEEHSSHIKMKESARAEKRNDKNSAIAGKCHTLAMDVQAVLMAPRLNAGALYYRTKLNVHNFSVYNLKSRHAKCFLWDESEGGLVASTFATCLIDYLESQFTDELPIIIYSDGCGNQNRNSILSTALLDYAIRKNKTVIQKYMEKGHTQMEVDSVHARIEENLDGKIIELPTEYVNICKEARKKPFPYEVQYMKFSDFVDFTKNQRYNDIRPGNKSGEHRVTDLRQIKYLPTGIIEYKLLHDGEWEDLPRKPRSVLQQDFPKLYNRRQPIVTRKYNDLQYLCSVISEESHEFFNLLPHK